MQTNLSDDEIKKIALATAAVLAGRSEEKPPPSRRNVGETRVASAKRRLDNHLPLSEYVNNLNTIIEEIEADIELSSKTFKPLAPNKIDLLTCRFFNTSECRRNILHAERSTQSKIRSHFCALCVKIMNAGIPHRTLDCPILFKLDEDENSMQTEDEKLDVSILE